VALLHGPDSYAEATEQWVRCSFCDRLQVIERLRRAGLDVPVLRQLDLCVLPHLVDLALSDVPPQSAGDKRE